MRSESSCPASPSSSSSSSSSPSSSSCSSHIPLESENKQQLVTEVSPVLFFRLQAWDRVFLFNTRSHLQNMTKLTASILQEKHDAESLFEPVRYDWRCWLWELSPWICIKIVTMLPVVEPNMVNKVLKIIKNQPKSMFSQLIFLFFDRSIICHPIHITVYDNKESRMCQRELVLLQKGHEFE